MTTPFSRRLPAPCEGQGRSAFPATMDKGVRAASCCPNWHHIGLDCEKRAEANRRAGRSATTDHAACPGNRLLIASSARETSREFQAALGMREMKLARVTEIFMPPAPLCASM